MIVTKDIKTEILERLKTQELIQIGASEAECLELAHCLPFCKYQFSNSLA